MEISKKVKDRFRYMISILILFVMLFSNFSGIAYAGNAHDDKKDDVVIIQESEGSQTIAEWKFSDPGDQDTFLATSGTYKTASIFRVEGGPYFEDIGDGALKFQGWDDGKLTKYWVAALPTKGFENIILSSKQTSSGSGPRDFKVQISTDGNVWSDIEGSTVKVPKAKEYFGLNKISLTEDAKDREMLYIRWVVTSTNATDPKNEAVGKYGTGYIKDVSVEGSPIEGSEIVSPTVVLAKLPKPNADNVEVNKEITVKFNKNIVLNEGYNVTIKDEGGVSLEGLELKAEGNTLKINHQDLKYEKKYTIQVPQGIVKGLDDHIALAYDINWSFKTRISPKTPKLLNVTFNGDPKTTRAFAWYTEKEIEGTILQVVEASKVKDNVFPEDEATSYVGSCEIVDVFMSKDDRKNKNYTKYASHKVIANNLKSNTKYSYRVGNGDEDGWSIIGSFVTDAAENQDFHFAVGTDSHANSPDTAKFWKDTLRKAIDKVDPKFFILTGDLVDYGDQEPEWQALLGVPKEELANCTIVPVLGGHEVHDYDEDENTDTDNFYYHFNLPEDVGIGGRTQKGSVYAFEYGNALFMQFNSQFAGELDEDGNIEYDDEEFYAQLEWMRNQVAKSDKKWKFVSFHKGPYSVGDNGTLWETNRMKFYRKYLIPVFDELGVDVVFVGHDHMYMRSFQMLNDVPLKDYDKHSVINPKGTVYMMTNTVGYKFYDRTTEDEDGNPIPEDKLPVDYWSWIDEQPGKKMFIDVSVTDNELKLTSYTAAMDEEPKVYDYYTIKRDVEEKDVKKPFPQHTAYSEGVIKPNHITQDKMDQEVKRLYNEWKSKYLKQNPFDSNQYYVWYSDGDWFQDGDEDDKIAITVSEAHGYGMLITALMAGYDKDIKTYFDGMYRYFRAHPSAINKDLMAWRQGIKDGKIIDISGTDSATDGDMDIAYALLIAHNQWGSEGEINYLAEAKKVINAIMKDEVNQTDWNLKVGDWASDKDAKLTRTSDFMMQHLKAFREASGDSRWDKVIDKTYSIINDVFTEFSPNTGILPDFLVNIDGKFTPPNGEVLETEYDGYMGYNACRTPWRVATDYIMTKDSRAIAQLNKINAWIRQNTDNNPENIFAGYKLDGTLIEERDYQDISFSSPFMVSAMVNLENQEWLNKLWDHNIAVKTEEDFYFGNTIRLINAIVVSGNWWSPVIKDEDSVYPPVYPPEDKDRELNRIFGQNRIETSIQIAKELYANKAPDGIVLATANDFADALAGSTLAYKFNAPLLLINKSINDSKIVLDYITNNLSKGKDIFILGGESVVKSEISDFLKEQGYNIIRLGGLNRYETSKNIADYIKAPVGCDIVLANGENFADALSISSIAAIKGYPVLLNKKDNLSENISKYITYVSPKNVYILGGTQAISANVEKQIKELGKDINIVRIGGKDRYETSIKIADYFNLVTDTISIATGLDFPDALSGSLLAANKNSSILLVDNKDITKQKALLNKKNISNVIVFGGEKVVSKDVVNSLIKR